LTWFTPKTTREYAEDRARYQAYINRLQEQIERLNMERNALPERNSLGYTPPCDADPLRHELSVLTQMVELLLQLQGNARIRVVRYILGVTENSV
jgi:hypothetical protein